MISRSPFSAPAAVLNPPPVDVFGAPGCTGAYSAAPVRSRPSLRSAPICPAGVPPLSQERPEAAPLMTTSEPDILGNYL